MTFTTKIEIPTAQRDIQYSDNIVMLGSCFADNMASKMKEYFFQINANPFGTLYNPISIAHHMDDIPVCNADIIMVTFGTAWVYMDRIVMSQLSKENIFDAIVDNCRKRPACDFFRYRLCVDDIVNVWQKILDKYSTKYVIFTVSPIRHIKDGLHENQISKAILLQAIDKLTEIHKKNTSYFPSYEILLDELRDYRFYAEDMMHPSATAISYIWERFADTYLTSKSVQLEMQTLHKLYLDMQHKPLHPESKEYEDFIRRIQTQKDELKTKYPWI